METSTNANGQSQSNQPPKHARKEGYSINDILNAPVTSTDLDPGQYPARIAGFSNVFQLWSQFSNNKRGGYEPRFNVRFAIKDQGGNVRIMSMMMAPPTREAGGRLGMHSKSNIFKLSKVVMGGADALRAPGFSLASLIGKTANVVLETKNDFLNITQVVQAPHGTVFPSEEETATALAAFEKEATEESDSSGVDSEGNIPF